MNWSDISRNKWLYILIAIAVIAVISSVAILYFKPDISNWVLILSSLSFILLMILMILETFKEVKLEQPRVQKEQKGPNNEIVELKIGINEETQKFLKEYIPANVKLDKVIAYFQPKLSQSGDEIQSL
jgi:hypothetical protein